MRWWWLLVVVWAACGAPTSAKDDDDDDDRSTSDASGGAADVAGQVSCPNPIRPKQSKVCTGEMPVCCLGGPLGVTPRCAASLDACGDDSKLACDGASDCQDGRRCCASQQSGGSGTKILALCKASCNLVETETCAAEGDCADGGRCCLDDGDILGTCVKAGEACPVPETGG